MWLTRLVVGGSLAVAAACSSSTSPSCSNDCVTIQDFSFSPSTMTIKVGTRITWTNAGPSAHTATSDSGVWDSGTLGAPAGGGGYGSGMAGGSYQFTFNTPGTYNYHCKIHPPASYPGFTGTITVIQ
jgi:plastocyanin